MVVSSKVHLQKGGSGKALVILHDDVGSAGWLPFYEELARHFAGYVPSHPGYDKPILEETRPSILALWGNDGAVSNEDSMNSIRLLGQEVMPALREIGDELELNSPFDLNTPVSFANTPAEELTPAKA